MTHAKLEFVQRRQVEARDVEKLAPRSCALEDKARAVLDSDIAAGVERLEVEVTNVGHGGACSLHERPGRAVRYCILDALNVGVPAHGAVIASFVTRSFLNFHPLTRAMTEQTCTCGERVHWMQMLPQMHALR